ncbi:MAG: hypothetical protein E7027_00645 [Elusimicrobium sp.]|uniref:Lipoprotein n=1 Tax=Candidatus Avelusimicrobium gallicola TaxID=2562704 RepID=A0A928DNJ9_9BACT|nr:hypothetical protein [Elusimicrobium sp.]
MKLRLSLSVLLAVLLCACAGTDFRSRKQIAQGLDYSHYPAASDTYYEFTSALPDEPSVLADSQTDVSSTEEEALNEDEDFSAENLASTYGTYGDVVITVAKRKFKLGGNASRKEMGVFQQSLDKAYAQALRTYRPSGFTYSISSVGAVNPLSDIEVSCKLSERSANDVGQNTCDLFFNTIRTSYVALMKEAN